MSSSLSISICVLCICGLLVFRFVDMFFSVPSLVFELSLSIKVEFDRHPPKPNPTQPMVFGDQRWFAILHRNGIESSLG